MTKFRIPSALRSAVVRRAYERCEYCQFPEEVAWASYAIDHIIAEKHGGKTETDNLAYACVPCNSHKGSDLTSIDPQTGEVSRLFNPRTQTWDKHFRLDLKGTISGLTPEGRSTARLLHFNDPIRVQRRAYLITAGKLVPQTPTKKSRQARGRVRG